MSVLGLRVVDVAVPLRSGLAAAPTSQVLWHTSRLILQLPVRDHTSTPTLLFISIFHRAMLAVHDGSTVHVTFPVGEGPESVS